MNVPKVSGDEVQKETSPLVISSGEGSNNEADVEHQHNDNITSNVNGNDDIAEEYELAKPWPATFERSISILAVTTMDSTFLEEATRSPKITPLYSMQARVRTINQKSTFCSLSLSLLFK